MNAIWVTCMRTIGMARNLYSTAVSVFGYLAVSAVAFALMLLRHEGDVMPVVSLWALSASYMLPVLAALLSMDSWSGERQSGRIAMLLSVAVRERDYVLGKFFGVWTMTMLTTIVFLLSSVIILLFIAPAALYGVGFASFFPALLILALQGAFYCAVSTLFSAAFHHAAVAACTSLVFMVVLPRGLWLGVQLLSETFRVAYGEMPLDAHVLDFASGMVSSGVALSYLAVTGAALFITSKRILQLRAIGKRALGLRLTSAFAMLLAAVAAALAVALSMRLDAKMDVQLSGSAVAFSPRTREVLSEVGSGLSVTAFMSRSDPRSRSVGQFLRALKREAVSVGSTRFGLRFVDPNWDLAAAEQLVRRGVVEDSIVFERGRRISVVALRDGYGERICAAAIRRLLTPPQRHNIYWTFGHGEFDAGEYGPFGMSDIARELALDGFSNARIDLNAEGVVPNDCALIVIAGATHDFSRTEIGKIESYLQGGGRLLVLMGREHVDGVSSVLTAWGLRPNRLPTSSAKTLDGGEILVSEFSDHLVSEPLRGSRIVMAFPTVFESSAVADTGVDRIRFDPLALVGGAAVAASVSRGTGIGDDLAIRPTRIVAVGDASFATNGSLATRANANRDFFLNCVAYLAGMDSLGSSGTAADRLVLNLSRDQRILHAAISALGVPLLVLLVMAAVVHRRRRRS